ncbi:hypothetical protein LAZ67_7002912 [Cordylochernes scorpioides]|uniref:Tc1-like transposase DDE domain-containing protein n=1 Tax=Cordylochernes scorpioides TaxID=51811 RepID=A0ABY6KNF7_9ARAC|nr:hypothetical protein LAZ67_7002912 [Cordylochernes scorpioides]
MPGHRKRRQFKQTDAFTRGMVIGLKRASWSIRQIAADTHLGASTVQRLEKMMSRVSACPVIVAVYACDVDVEKGPIRQQLWNAPPCDNGTMTAQRYVYDVLRPVTLPYLQGVPNALYQQDNARPHTARISQQALQDVQMLPWPPYSPDLSPIEHVWDIIGRCLHALPQPRSEDELWQMVEREWRAIPQDAIRTLIDSLPRRVAACIAVRDLSKGPTPGIRGAVSVLMLESAAKASASMLGTASNYRQSQTFTKVCLDHGAMINESCTPIPHSMRSDVDLHAASPVAQNKQGRVQDLGRGFCPISIIQSPQTSHFATSKQLSILQCNINGLCSTATKIKLEEIMEIAEKQKIQIIALQETKLNEKYNLKFKNYNILRKDRNKEGGGLAFLIKNLYYEDIAINIPNTSDLEAQDWKTATIIPIKKLDKSADDPKNYRPISLTNALNRTFGEALLIQKQLEEHELMEFVKQNYDMSGFAIYRTACKLRYLQKKLSSYGVAVMSRRRVFEWYKRFKEGREETADNERSGTLSTSTTPEKVDKVLELVREDRRITVREVAEEAGISFGSTQSIMKDILGNARKETASLNLEATTDDPELLKRVITGDETWIYGFDSETTQQASEWRFKNEPRPKKARKTPSKVKVMLTVFFDYQGIVHHEFQQQGSTITADSYLGVLRRLREAIRQKRPELWRSKSWILHHDNAPAHTALKISKFLQDHSTSVLPQPPYSPDLAPCDFFLFGKLKKKLKGRKFQSIEEIKVESKKAMKAIPKTDYQRCFADWKKRWLKCIAANGDYFEGDNLNLVE